MTFETSAAAIDKAIDECAQFIPPAIEERAVNMFEAATEAMTGHVWVWADSSDEIRNQWRIRAFVENFQYSR